MTVDGRGRLTLLGLADFDIRDAAIMAEDQEQGVLVNVVGEITDVDGVGNDLRKDSVVGSGSGLALLRLCEGEEKSLMIAKSLWWTVSD
jgi:hypothetical protein